MKVCNPYLITSINQNNEKIKRFATCDEHDKQSIAMIGLLWARLLCVDLSDKPAIPKDLDNYVLGVSRLGFKICHTLSG